MSLEICKKKKGINIPMLSNHGKIIQNEVCSMFNYVSDLRRIMYTTNTIESLNRRIRKLSNISLCAFTFLANTHAV